MGEESRIERQKRGKLTNTSEYNLSDNEGTIGVVRDEDARATKKEPRVEGGVTREVLGKRFSAIESSPTLGPTSEHDHSIGVVRDEDARATHKESAFVGMERKLGGSLNDRFFGQGETIPRSGPTLPT